MVILFSLFLGTTLAATAGLRAFLPLFLVGLLERADLLEPFSIGENFAWLTSDIALLTLGIATLVEILADKIPLIDSGLDSFMTFVRPGAGALSVFAVVTSQDPLLGYVAGLALAGGATLPIHLGKGTLRLGSHVFSAGAGSPLLSTAEDATSVGVIFLSIFIPILAVVFGLFSIAFIIWIIKRTGKKRLAT